VKEYRSFVPLGYRRNIFQRSGAAPGFKPHPDFARASEVCHPQDVPHFLMSGGRN